MSHLTQPAAITRLTETEPLASPTPRSHLQSHTLPTRTSHPPTSTRPTSGSATQTQTSTSTPEEHVVLRLRGAHDPSARRRIQWAEDVVDNENLGRKSSKVCCIYHAPKEVGESSDESDSSSSSDDDDSSGGEEDGGAGMAGAGKGKGRRSSRKHENEHGEDCEHGGGKKPNRNAYERMPKNSGNRQKAEMVKK